MKITKERLKRLIREELLSENVVPPGGWPTSAPEPWISPEEAHKMLGAGGGGRAGSG